MRLPCRILGPIICVIAIALIVPPPCEAAGDSKTPAPVQEWQRFTVKDEEFTVMLPALPAMRTQKIYVMQLRKTRTERQLGSYGNGVVYTIRSVENLLDESLDALIAPRAKSNNRVDIALNGVNGKQVEFTTTHGVHGATHFFKTKKRFYEFSALGAPLNDPRLQQFFSSITLGGDRKGSEVEDGMGTIPSAVAPVGEPEQLYTGRDVDRKVVLVMKPEPSYTESARQGQITGTVVLKAVFSSNGAVTDIRTVTGLPYGLTERAIFACKQIRFLPAAKDGKFVSVWMQLEYNFNLY